MTRILLISLMTVCLLYKSTWLIGIGLMILIMNYYSDRKNEEVEV